MCILLAHSFLWSVGHNREYDAWRPAETQASDVIGGGDESVGEDQVEAAQREGIDIEAETAGSSETSATETQAEDQQ